MGPSPSYACLHGRPLRSNLLTLIVQRHKPDRTAFWAGLGAGWNISLLQFLAIVARAGQAI